MKKQLLTTTALIAAGVLAGGSAFAQANGPAKTGKPVLSIGGWVEGIVGTASENNHAATGTRVGWDSQYDSEFHFLGSVTLDNGIRIRTHAELEGEVSGDQWDEAYMSISGSFGELRVGSMDNAIYEALTPISGTWATNVGQNTALDRGDWIAAPKGASTGNVRLNIGDNDSNKINYFTPRVEGFQIALSYLPSFEECEVSGTNASQNTQCNSSLASVSNNAHNGWSAGFTFDRKFDGIRTAFGAGYITAKRPANIVNNNDPGGNPEGWSVGGLVGWGGFRVAAGYKQERNMIGKNANEADGTVSSLTSGDSNVFELGGRYNWGKNWVSLGWINSKGPGSKLIAGDNKSDVLLASYRRTLGPGVQYRFNVFYANFQGENPGSTDDARGYAVTTSVRVAF